MPGLAGDVIDRDASEYTEQEGCLYRTVRRGSPILLADFVARVVQKVKRFEAGKVKMRYWIAATHSDPKVGRQEIVVDADDFTGMQWVARLGPEFSISTGRGIRDQVRHAIQLLGRLDCPGGIPSIEEHTAIGWIRHGDRNIYVHACGAIGADGLGVEFRVDPWPGLENYRLPAPDPAIVRRAIRGHLGIWELGSTGSAGARHAAAIVATLPVRAVLGPCNFMPHLVGPTGSRKTSLARVAYQHFADVRGRDAALSASWMASPASLQGLLHACGDSLLAIDDLKFTKSVDVAEEVAQMQGNLQGRTRMNPDQTPQRSLVPRGAILSTGEITIESESGLGRALTIEIGPGDIDLRVLARVQADADSGLFRAMIAAYVDHLARRLNGARAEYERLKEKALAEIEAMPGAHSRHPDAIAQLIAGYEVFLAFALQEGAIDERELAHFSALARRELVSIGKGQADSQGEARTGRRFLDLIASQLRSGRCHLLAVNEDEEPNHHEACGWRRELRYDGDGGQEYHWVVPSFCKCIGYVDDRDKMMVYLYTAVSRELASEMVRRSRNSMAISFSRVGQALMAEGLCVPAIENKKKRPDGRHRIRKTQERYFAIPMHYIVSVDKHDEGDAALKERLDQAGPMSPLENFSGEEFVSSMCST